MLEVLRIVLSPEDFQKVEALPVDELTDYADAIQTTFNKPDAKTQGVMVRKIGILVPPSYIAVKLQKDNDMFKSALKQLDFTKSIQQDNPSLFNQMLDQSMVSERFVTRYLAEHPSVKLNATDAAALDDIRGWISERR
jgi:hypothetical protein